LSKNLFLVSNGNDTTFRERANFANIDCREKKDCYSRHQDGNLNDPDLAVIDIEKTGGLKFLESLTNGGYEPIEVRDMIPPTWSVILQCLRSDSQATFIEVFFGIILCPFVRSC